MTSSWKRSPALWAVIFWSLSAFMYTGYNMTLAPHVQRHDSDYSSYLSTRLRVGGYFEHSPDGVWAVVRYRVGADGKLLEGAVLDTNGTCAQARFILEGVRVHAPFQPLPDGAKSLTVTELFWAEGDVMPPGSLAEKLQNEGDDGRVLEFEY